MPERRCRATAHDGLDTLQGHRGRTTSARSISLHVGIALVLAKARLAPAAAAVVELLVVERCVRGQEVDC